MRKTRITRLSLDLLANRRSQILDYLEPMPRTLNIGDFDIRIRNAGDLPDESRIPGRPRDDLESKCIYEKVARAIEIGDGETCVVRPEDLEAAFAMRCAELVVGAERVDRDPPPLMGSEDFGWMLRARPGCYALLGAGEGPMLHHPRYDFNDLLIPVGAHYWVTLATQPLDA